MHHIFDVELATKYGMEEAIILQNIAFWTQKYIANNEHYHDGLHWLYNSLPAWKNLFPYITENKIRRALGNLIEEGLIVVSNYNENGYNRTKWYALTIKGLDICRLKGDQLTPPSVDSTDASVESEASICGNGGIRSVESTDVIYTDNKPLINTIKIKKDATVVANVAIAPFSVFKKEILDYYNSKTGLNVTGSKHVLKNIEILKKEGYTVEQIKKVINYIVEDRWHKEHDQYGLSVICKPTKFYEKLEKAELQGKLYGISNEPVYQFNNI